MKNMKWVSLVIIGWWLELGGCMATSSTSSSSKKPIVWSIAGSDSGGGAGIQADLHAIHSMGGHGCTVLTCLTAQNSQGVSMVEPVSKEMIESQLKVLWEDLPPRAIKIGALLTTPVVQTVGQTLQQLLLSLQDSTADEEKKKPWIVLDPVMISTSGHSLLQEDAIRAMKELLFPIVDIVTPNRFEAEALLGRKLMTPASVEQAAKDILQQFNVKSVLIKGGHSDMDRMYAQDYFLSSTTEHDGPSSNDNDYRLCDATRGVWLRTKRYDTNNTHGTGCTLSSAIATALAISHLQNDDDDNNISDNEIVGSKKSIQPVDAISLAKAYVTAGIAQSIQLGQGPGPVVHTSFPNHYDYFPTIVKNPESNNNNECQSFFLPMKRPSTITDVNENDLVLGKILPIVDSIEWIQRLCQMENNNQKVRDVQLRIKGMSDSGEILKLVKEAQDLCSKAGIRLWINDYWEIALEAKCFGVHVGQEDLATCVNSGGCDKLKQAGMALGISTHSYAELAIAMEYRPSYISVGPIYGTTSKDVKFAPQRLSTLQHWRTLIGPDIPLVSIGGISNPQLAKENKDAGADCIAVIGAITQHDSQTDIVHAIDELHQAME